MKLRTLHTTFQNSHIYHRKVLQLPAYTTPLEEANLSSVHTVCFEEMAVRELVAADAAIEVRGVTAVEGLQLESTVHSTLDPAIFIAPSELIRLAYKYTLIGTAGKTRASRSTCTPRKH